MRRKFEEFHCKDEVKMVQENNPKLKSLDLRGGRPVSNINDEDMILIITELSKNSVVSELSLAENDISDKGLIGIEAMKHIKVLDLSSNRLTDDGMQHLAKMSQLTSLNISDNNISEKGVEILLEKLENLESFMISDVDAKLIKTEKIPKDLVDFYIIGEEKPKVSLKKETTYKKDQLPVDVVKIFSHENLIQLAECEKIRLMMEFAGVLGLPKEKIIINI